MLEVGGVGVGDSLKQRGSDQVAAASKEEEGLSDSEDGLFWFWFLVCCCCFCFVFVLVQPQSSL